MKQNQQPITNNDDLINKAKALPLVVDMVRKVQDGAKTQSRRPVLNLPIKLGEGWEVFKRGKWHHLGNDASYLEVVKAFNSCPFGEVGSLLWIREPAVVKTVVFSDQGWPQFVRLRYLSDNKSSELLAYPERLKWIPKVGHGVPNGIFKEAGRIFVRVERVWYEHLQAISGEDILAEGVKVDNANPAMGPRWWNMQRMAFENLWDSIYKTRTWARNPLVCACSFKAVNADQPIT